MESHPKTAFMLLSVDGETSLRGIDDKRKRPSTFDYIYIGRPRIVSPNHGYS